VTPAQTKAIEYALEELESLAGHLADIRTGLEKVLEDEGDDEAACD